MARRKALRPTSATTEREPQDGDLGRIASVANPKASTWQASRRDTPVACVACGKRSKRKGRHQKYCSRRCRQRDYWDRRALANISAVVTHHSAHSTPPPQIIKQIQWTATAKIATPGLREGTAEPTWRGRMVLAGHDATRRANAIKDRVCRNRWHFPPAACRRTGGLSESENRTRSDWKLSIQSI